MRKLLVVVGLSMFAAACSNSNGSTTSTPAEACTSIATAACDRASSCNLLTNGVTTQQCITTAENLAGCSTITCKTGKTFSSANATSCVDAINAQSCTDIGNAVTPEVCNTICQ